MRNPISRVIAEFVQNQWIGFLSKTPVHHQYDDLQIIEGNRLEEGETEEQVQHEATVARRLYLHMEEGKPHPLPPEDAEVFADKIYQIAINAEDLLVELRQELEVDPAPETEALYARLKVS